LTRSWNALAHGNVSDAVRFHPLGPLTFVGALAVAVAPPEAVDRALARYPGAVAAFGFAWMAVWIGRIALGMKPTSPVEVSGAEIDA
jgi:hypothetical protein